LGADGAFGGGPEGGRYVGVDVADDCLGGGVALGQGGADLGQAFLAVVDVVREDCCGVFDDRAVAGEEAGYVGWGVGEGLEAVEGVEIGA
jgi:hypothetical protein